MSRISASVTVLASSLAACSGLVDSRGARGRGSQAEPILAEVLRFQVQDLAKNAALAQQSAVCVALRQGDKTVDPGQRVMRQLPGSDRIREQSRCPADNAGTLVAGPIDWLSDTEVRVRSVRKLAHETEAPLVYRVVRDAGRWACVGAVIAYDPL